MNDSDPAEKEHRSGCCSETPTFYDDYSQEGSYENETSTPFPIHSYEIVVFLGFLETVIALAAVVGNILVIASVYTNRKLRTITNLFVVSLAFSDLLVGLLVLPFSIKLQVTGVWGLGEAICSIFVTLDVLLCTASILNLCCISIDRYFAITRPLASATNRSKRLALPMIGAVWLLSVIITIPPLLGWKERNRPRKDGVGDHDCDLIQEEGYVIYSALGSFYIPMAIMLFVYANIFVVARRAQRRWRSHSSRGSSQQSSKRGSTPPSPVAALSPSTSGDDVQRGAAVAGVRPRAIRVMSAASDTLCCGCFGRGHWTGTYSLTVADDWILPPGVGAESYDRQTTPGYDVTRRSLLIYDARPCSEERDPKTCSLDRDKGRCSAGHGSNGQCPARPCTQLSNLGYSANITNEPVTRRSSSQLDTRPSGVGPSSTRGSDPIRVPCVEGTTALPMRTTTGTSPSSEQRGSDAQNPPPPITQKSTSSLFCSWKRRHPRHSSFDGFCLRDTRPTKTHSSDNHDQTLCNNMELVTRYFDSLPTRLIRNGTATLTNASTTSSSDSRASTRSGGSGASAEGNYTDFHGATDHSDLNPDRALNPRRGAQRFGMRSTQHGDKISCKTTLESTAVGLTENPELSSEPRTREPDASLFESPRRRLTTGELNSSYRRSIRRSPRSPQNHDDTGLYGSFGDVTMTSMMARQMSRQMSRQSQKTTTTMRLRREHSAVFRESKTVKTVSIVIGCFVLCWLPFFVVYISEPFLSEPFATNPYLKQFVTWLGYFNSVINPFIYAFYNSEFRTTFWQLTIGRLWRRGVHRPRGVGPSSPLNNVLRHQLSLRNNSVIVLSRLTTNR